MSSIRLGAPLRRAARIGLPLVSAAALLAAVAAPAGAATVRSGGGQHTGGDGGGSQLAGVAGDPTALTPTTTTLRISPNPVERGHQLTMTATVAPAPADGTVTISVNGSAPLADCVDLPVDPVTGTARCTTVAPPFVATVDLIANYSDGTSSDDSSDVETLVITASQTMTIVMIDPQTPIAGGYVRVTAYVDPAPTSGSVDFERAEEPVGECTGVPVVSGQATCELLIPSSEYDAQTVRAKYLGSSDFRMSSGETTFDPLAALIAITPAPVAFGDVVVGQTATRVVTVTNNGDGDLEILDQRGLLIYDDEPAFSAGGASDRAVPSNDTDYAVVSSDCDGATLAPGGSCTVTVSLAPTAPGARPGTLWVRGNASNDDTVALTGTGLGAPVDEPDTDPPSSDDPVADPPPSDEPVADPPAREQVPPVTPPAAPATPTPPALTQVAAVTAPAPSPESPARGAVFSPGAPTKVPVAPTGGVQLPLTCPSGSTCTVDGTLTLTVATGAKARAAAAKTTVLIRFSGIKVAAAKTKTLSLRLPAAFVKQQQAKGVRKLRTTLTLKTTTGDGRTVVTRKQVTLLIPRARVAQRTAAAEKPARRPSFTG